MFASNSPARSGVARHLLAEGARIEARNLDGDTSLMRAAFGGHEALVQLLLDLGASRLPKDSAGDDARALAVKAGHVGVVERLKTAEEAEAAKRPVGCSTVGDWLLHAFGLGAVTK